MNKKRIILIGGGGHCKSCIDVIEQTQQFDIVGIVDMKERVGESLLGYPIIGTDDDIAELKNKTDFFLITLGQIGLPKRRKTIFGILQKEHCKLATVISPKAYVSRHASIAEGAIIMHQAMVNAGAYVGENSIINSKALVEHDAKVGNHCHVSTGSIINGGVLLGHDSFYGSGAASKEYIKIPERSFIKANSMVK